VDPGHKIVAVVESDDVDDDGVFSMELWSRTHSLLPR
jgi:hypothetical protein